MSSIVRQPCQKVALKIGCDQGWCQRCKGIQHLKFSQPVVCCTELSQTVELGDAIQRLQEVLAEI